MYAWRNWHESDNSVWACDDDGRHWSFGEWLRALFWALPCQCLTDWLICCNMMLCGRARVAVAHASPGIPHSTVRVRLFRSKALPLLYATTLAAATQWVTSDLVEWVRRRLWCATVLYSCDISGCRLTTLRFRHCMRFCGCDRVAFVYDLLSERERTVS